MHLIGFYYQNISRCTVLWMSHNWKCGVDTVWIFSYPVNRMWNKMSHYADSSMDSGIVEELSASIIRRQKLKDSKTTYKLLGPWNWKQRDPLKCLLLSAVHIRSFSIRLESVYFSIYLFLFVLSRKGLWPAGYRTCQFHLSLSVYITIHYNKYKHLGSTM